MQKIKNILLTFFILFFVSGCYQSEITLNINSDKSIDLNAKVLVENDFKEDTFSKNKAIYDNRNIKIERITESNTKGYIISKKYNCINDISTTDDITIDISNYLDPAFDDTYLFRVDKSYLKNKYTANFTISSDYIKKNFVKKEETTSEFLEIIKDLYNKAMLDYGKSTDEKEYSSSDNALELQTNIKYSIIINNKNVQKIEVSDNNYSYTKENVLLNEIAEDEIIKLNNDINPGIKFVVKLPTKTISNNAKEVSNSGETLTWLLDSNSNNSINFTFELHNRENYFIAFGVIVGTILLIVLLSFLAVKFKNSIRKKEENKPIYKSEIEKDDVPEVISIDDK